MPLNHCQDGNDNEMPQFQEVFKDQFLVAGFALVIPASSWCSSVIV